MITAARKFGDSDDVLAMDIFPQNLNERVERKSLPEDGSVYLCDAEGTLLYASTKWEVSETELQHFAGALIGGIRDGSLLSYDAFFQDPDEVERGVYYCEMSNGWTVILTIPLQNVLMGERNLPVMVLAAVSALVMAAMVVMLVRDLMNSRRIRRADSTIHILGDSFYAIYRVNYNTGTYEAIKLATDMERTLPKTGEYQSLIDTIGTLVEPETFHEFARAFSLESIRQRVADKVPDYGGDYQRRFGGVYRWVNIRTLYDSGRVYAEDRVLRQATPGPHQRYS